MNILRWIMVLLLFLVPFVEGDDSISLNYPDNGNTCVIGTSIIYQYTPLVESLSSCHLYNNFTGSWDLRSTNSTPSANVSNFFNDSTTPGIIKWGIKCINSTGLSIYSSNYTFNVVNAPYCAILSGTTCTENVSLGSEQIFKTRLGNTRGFWLKDQQCNIWITNIRGEIVKSFDTMLYMAETNLQTDKDGNTINIAEKKVPLTDSNGYYIFPFTVDKSWAWYNDNFTIWASCNGQTTTCMFTPTIERLPDTNDLEALGVEASGIFILFAILIFVLVKYGSLILTEIKTRVRY
jgi:hypothetical protein